QVSKLKDIWSRLLILFEQPGEEIQLPKQQETKPKKSGSLFSLGSKKEEPVQQYFLGVTSDPRWTELSLGKALPLIPGKLLHTSFWGLVTTSNPDSIVLRFLRARNWDTDAAYCMLVNTLRWRIHMRIDEIIALGETGLIEALEKAKEGLGIAFKDQLDRKLVTLGGPDRRGRGVCFVNVQVHTKDNQPLEVIKLLTVYIMETSRTICDYPVDTVCIVFNLENFTLSNMDFEAVKFLVGCFQAYYPETLGLCCVHKAPWVFSTIWNLITPILDPVVASKILFTKTTEELEKYVDEDSLPIIITGNKDKPCIDDLPSNRESIPGQIITDDPRAKLYWDTVAEYEAKTKDWAQMTVIDGIDRDAMDRLKMALQYRKIRIKAEKVLRGETSYHTKGLICIDHNDRFLIKYNTNTWREKDVTEWV
ncbi:hypothetical protein CU098_000326, partial [Rhizopus stolonifer]